jgi:CubicO group peptidase (beta-lactamase class C family)
MNSFDHLAGLDEAIAAETYRDIRSVVVLRDGGVVAERYYNGATRETLHDPRSATKTIASAALGLGLRDGHVRSLDQTLGEFFALDRFDNPSSDKELVTLRHLVTMSSGFDGFDFDPTSPGNEEHMYPQVDWVRWALGLPMATDRRPGERWYYFTAGIVLLGDILDRVLPGGLEAYVDRHLFAPLGIRQYEWQYTPQGVPNTAGGLRMRPLDLASFGELYRAGGRWRGEQVLPEQWVAESMSPHYETTDRGFRYGYLWWNSSFSVAGNDVDVWFCSGNGGNKVFVFTAQRLVIVITAGAYGKPYMHDQVDAMMTRHILPAVGV